MGQFEIRGTKSKDLVPDLITLNINAKSECRDALDNDEAIIQVKDALKESVVKLICEVQGISEDCKVSLNNLSYSKSCNSFDTNVKPFGQGKKKQEKHVGIIAVVNLQISLSTRDENTLMSILKLLLNSISIVNITGDVSVLDLEGEYLKLTSEVCKKCRKDAEMIASSLGTEIMGVGKVAYNSSGNMLDSTVYADDFKTADTLFDDFDEDFECSDFDFGAEVEYNDIWAKGFVNSILDRRFTISDSVQVVFIIK